MEWPEDVIRIKPSSIYVTRDEMERMLREIQDKMITHQEEMLNEFFKRMKQQGIASRKNPNLVTKRQNKCIWKRIRKSWSQPSGNFTGRSVDRQHGTESWISGVWWMLELDGMEHVWRIKLSHKWEWKRECECTATGVGAKSSSKERGKRRNHGSENSIGW